MPQTDTCRLSSQISGLSAVPYAYEKFGVLFKSSRPRPLGWVTGLPARVRRHLTSAIGIRKAGQVSILHIEPSGERKGESACSYGRAVAKIVCALRSMTLKCNTQRASFSFTSVSGRRVQFDSDYSVEDGAPPLFFFR